MSAELATDAWFYEQTEAVWRGWWNLALGNVQVQELTDKLFDRLGEPRPSVSLSMDQSHSFTVGGGGIVFSLGEVSPLVVAHEAAHILEARWRIDPGPTGHGPSTFDAMCWTAAIVEEIVGEM